jgi:3-oxoacyl-[acyl-carrier protein] reductase
VFDFNGSVAIVTGGGRGIGEAAVRKLAAGGAKVAVVDIDESRAKQVSGSIDPDGIRAIGVECDISSAEAAKRMVDLVIGTFGAIHILVNNAGITRDAMFHKMDFEQWRKVIDVNLNGIFHVTRNVVPHMREQKYGKIVSVSSTSAFGAIGQTNYAAAKAGIIGFTKSLAKELARYNINVNTIEPGLTATDIIKTIPAKVMEMSLNSIPLGRIGQPEDQANAICFLASEEASYITGVELQVCGGATIV